MFQSNARRATSTKSIKQALPFSCDDWFKLSQNEIFATLQRMDSSVTQVKFVYLDMSHYACHCHYQTILIDPVMALHSESESSDNFCSSNENQSVFKAEKYPHITKKGSLKWEGSFESIQSFFDLFLNLQTKWSTPRVGCKQYVADNGLEIRWYSSSKSLCFNG